ncbi:MAG: hypothetical protein QOF37_411 [Thermoleophilaceae bacterium]|jgi:hypothetical protein|nr:hypothetical protein [Thermoleophilaceae bacterium]
MDFIRRVGPVDRDIEPVYRVERAHDEPEERDPEERERKPRPRTPPPAPAGAEPEGPREGDDGHLHVDIRA